MVYYWCGSDWIRLNYFKLSDKSLAKAGRTDKRGYTRNYANWNKYGGCD